MVRVILMLLIVLLSKECFGEYAWFIDIDGKAIKYDFEKQIMVANTQLNYDVMPSKKLGSSKGIIKTSDKYAFIVVDTDNGGRTIAILEKETLKLVKKMSFESTDDVQEYPLMLGFKNSLFFTWADSTEEDDVLHGAVVSYSDLTKYNDVDKAIELGAMYCLSKDNMTFYEVDIINNTVNNYDSNINVLSSKDYSNIWSWQTSNKAIENCLGNKFLFVEFNKETKQRENILYNYSDSSKVMRVKVNDQGSGQLTYDDKLIIAGTKNNKGNLNIYDFIANKKIKQINLQDSYDSIVYLANGVINPSGNYIFVSAKLRNSGKDVLLAINLVTYEQKVLTEGFSPVYFISEK